MVHCVLNYNYKSVKWIIHHCILLNSYVFVRYRIYSNFYFQAVPVRGRFHVAAWTRCPVCSWCYSESRLWSGFRHPVARRSAIWISENW